METANDDGEAILEASIAEYELQLEQLNAAIEVTSEGLDSENREEILKLREEMKQLIDLSKENLLSMKKKRLLREIDLISGNFDSDSAEQTSDLSVKKQENSEFEDELRSLIGSLEGTRCQAPFGYEWGQTGYHNALILNVEPHDNIDTIEDIKVRVVFCNPQSDAMKPCPFFLSGSCRFDDEKCRFSHGRVVSFNEINKFIEPNYSILQRDSRCLAKYKDDLWYPAIVEMVGDDHTVLVKYLSYDDEATLQLEDVLPQEMSYESESESESSGSSTDEDDLDDALPVAVWISTDPMSQALGQWEKHTRGIGSKLMAKMGYVLGMGLGKHGEGRTEPIEAVVLPPGKSLDKIMELRERAGNRDLRQVEKKLKRKQRKGEKKIEDGYNHLPKSSVFDFINEKLATRKQQNGEAGKSNSVKSCEGSSLTTQKLKEVTVKNLNTQSFKVSEDIRRAEMELRRLQLALTRNQSSDKLIASQVKQKIAMKEKEINDLKAYEKAIQGEQNSRNTGIRSRNNALSKVAPLSSVVSANPSTCR